METNIHYGILHGYIGTWLHRDMTIDVEVGIAKNYILLHLRTKLQDFFQEDKRKGETSFLIRIFYSLIYTCSLARTMLCL